MAISSVSRIYDAPDPILENDLELLAKVNTFQQTKFDQGAQALQNEVNNWAMLADVAKPQDKEYINQKLNNLVTGVQNLGGVDLGDPNNVNQLKSLGYNVYGDNAIINAVATTKKLRNFMTDAKTKLAGKEGKNYDSVYYEYNLDKWNEWLNDGQTGTDFNGPTELQAGNFEQYQKKIQDAVTNLAKNSPDSESMPQGGDALNYLQVGSKFIKKERIKTLIDSMTTAQDADVISAHAWKNMGGLPDDNLVKLNIDSYSAKQKALQVEYNHIKHQKGLTTDFNQAEEYQRQLDQINGAIKTIGKQKTDLFTETNGKALSKEQRQGMRSNLYFDAFKDDFATANAFEQNKTELKFNQGKAFQLKEARGAYEFGQMMNYRKAQFDLELRKQDFEENKTMMEFGLLYGDGTSSGMGGPSSGAPLALVENMGKDDAAVFNGETVKNANLNYIASSTKFYQDAYNTIGSLPAYQKYVVKNAEGLFVPKDEASKKILDQAVLTKINQFDKISKMPLEDRKSLEKDLVTSDVEMMNKYQGLQEAQLYSQQVSDLEDQAFRKLGLDNPTNKRLAFRVKENGQWVPKEMSFADFRKNEDFWKTQDIDYNSAATKDRTMWELFKGSVNQTLKGSGAAGFSMIKEKVDDYYDEADWKGVSKNYSSFGKNVTLPKIKGGGVNQQLAQYFGDKVRIQAGANGDDKVKSAVTEADVDINRIWVKYDATSKGSKVRYMAEVKYQKGNTKGGDKLYKVDLTEDVLNNPDSYVSKLYPRDNSQIIYGFMMDKDGSTPFTADDNYASALKTTSNPKLTYNYRIVANKNPNNGVQSFNVDILIPKRDKKTGKVNYITQRVKNSFAGYSNNFPANYQATVDYMNEYFKNDQTVKQFYQMHNIPTE